MFKNLIDKAKKAADNLQEGLSQFEIKPVSGPGGSQGGTEKKPFDYDESYFTFTIDGGPKHSEAIIAIAKYRDGEKAGTPMPLLCKWFKSDAADEMKEIPDKTDAFYQPSVDDVGARIFIQATPNAEAGTYIGMPIFAEIGPLTLDPETEKEAMANLEQETCEININIQSIVPTQEHIAVPCDGSLVFNKKDRELSVYIAREDSKEKISSCSYSEAFPTVELDQSDNTVFEIHTDTENVIKCKTDNFSKRDVLAITIRLSGQIGMPLEPIEEQEQPEVKPEEIKDPIPVEQTNGEVEKPIEDIEKPKEEKPKEEQPEKPKEEPEKRKLETQPSANLESLMNIQQLTKKLKTNQKEHEKLKKEHDATVKSEKKLKDQVAELTSKLETIEKENEQNKEQLKNLLAEKEVMATEKLFYLQEINLFKSQVTDYEMAIQNYQKSEPNNRRFSVEKKEIRTQYDEYITHLKSKISKLEEDVEQLQKDKEIYKKENEEQQVAKEEMEAQINGLRNKVKSLVMENERLQSQGKVGSPGSTTPRDSRAYSSHHLSELEYSPSLPGLIHAAKSMSNEGDLNELDTMKLYEEEIKALKEQNHKLTTTLETLKLATDGDKKKGLFGSKTSKPGAQSQDLMQKLVNTLTETIGEKEIALENQRNINKALAKRVTELEEQIKSLPQQQS